MLGTCQQSSREFAAQRFPELGPIAAEKLRMDCIFVLRLRGAEEEQMVDPDFDERAAALIPRLFAILTARLEDGAEIAVSGQASGQSLAQISEAAGRLADLGHEIAALAEAIELLSASQAD
jgi:hypothetical protein